MDDTPTTQTLRELANLHACQNEEVIVLASVDGAACHLYDTDHYFFPR